jgi:hypothetical protein
MVELFREKFNNNTSQADLEKSSANYYVRDLKTPFIQSDLQGCRIIVADPWR